MKLLALLFVSTAFAATLVWEHDNPASLSGYNVHVYHTDFSHTEFTTNQSWEITGVPDGSKVSLSVSAVGTDGSVSDRSAPIDYVPISEGPIPSVPSTLEILQPPPSPQIYRAHWSRRTNDWHLAMDWFPVGEADAYVVTTENENGPVQTNLTTRTAFYATLEITNQWTVWLQSTNINGLSRREEVTFGPR